jgi:hypothetical protein
LGTSFYNLLVPLHTNTWEGAHRDVYQDIGRNKSLLFTKTLEMTLTLFPDCYLCSKNYVCLWCSVLVVFNLNSSGQTVPTLPGANLHVLIHQKKNKAKYPQMLRLTDILKILYSLIINCSGKYKFKIWQGNINY